MPLPGTIAMVGVTGSWFAPDGEPLDGAVEFVLGVRLVSSGQNLIVVNKAISAPVIAGVLQPGFELLANDDADLAPLNSYYTITESVGGSSVTYTVQFLTADGSVDLADVTHLSTTPTVSAGDIPLSYLTAKGALITATGAITAATLPIGTDDHVLTADSTEATGMKWAEAPAGGGGGGQPLDSDLTAIAALTPVDNDVLQRKSSAWVNRTPAELKVDLLLNAVNNTTDAGKPVSTATQTALDLKADDNEVVKLTTAQTVVGIKTFSDSPIVPTPTTDAQAATKLYVDLAASAGGQPLDSDLTAIAAIAPANDDIIQRKAGAWTNRTMAQTKTDLVLVKADVGLGSVDNTADSAKPVSTAQATADGLRLLAASNLADLTDASDARTNLGISTLAAPLFCWKTADQSVTSSTTLVDVTDLSVSVLASKVYIMDLVLFYYAQAASDIKFGLIFPVGCTGTWSGGARDLGSTSPNLTSASIATSIASGHAGTGGVVLMARFSALVHVSTTAGTFKVQFAQEVSGGTASEVKADSYMTMHQMT